ncbi:uncharacterized protein LOC135205493 isoform X2 [Macrobrachium nipponense]|uniref:uncharacterized protein LOC135205493 isoform X2 n=1 Tax=Macrobrachium nipponense TaxID=159736 RepID=UPI0030C8BA25
MVREASDSFLSSIRHESRGSRAKKGIDGKKVVPGAIEDALSSLPSSETRANDFNLRGLSSEKSVHTKTHNQDSLSKQHEEQRENQHVFFSRPWLSSVIAAGARPLQRLIKIVLPSALPPKYTVSRHSPGNGILFAQSNWRSFPASFTVSVVALLVLGLSNPAGSVSPHSSPAVSMADASQAPLGDVEQGLQWLVGNALKDLVRQKAEGCHLFLISASVASSSSSSSSSSLLRPLIRFWQREQRKATVEISLSSETNGLAGEKTDFLHLMVAETACWAVVLDLSTLGNLVLRFVEKSQLFYFPKIPVVAVGAGGDVEEFLLTEVALRNSIHTYYLAYSDSLAATFRESSLPQGRPRGHQLKGSLFIESWKKPLEVDNLQNLNGHVIRVVCLLRIPYITYNLIEGSPDKRVQYVDSYEFRITETAARLYNFTFEVREPWDGEWGVPDEHGNFSGIVGTLQYEKADFSFLLTPLPARLLGMDIGGVFIEDPFMILTHEPGPLPRSLAIVAPFGDTVWMGIVISGFVYGIGVWLVDRGWASYLKEKAMGLSYTLFYILRMLMEDPPEFVPRQVSVQFLLGWWGLVCFVLINAYKSALISYLTVIKTYDAINSMEDLWKRKDMTWGSIYMSESGASYIYLVTNPNPVIRNVAAKIQTLDADAHLERVLAGHYAYITRNSWALTDLLRIEIENLPIHTSISKYPVSCGYTWGFRKGSPLRAPIDKLQRRLVEAGLTKIWLREIVTKIAVEVRKTTKKLQSTAASAVRGQNRALTMEHLQGAFLLLGIGFGVALLVWSLK